MHLKELAALSWLFVGLTEKNNFPAYIHEHIYEPKSSKCFAIFALTADL